jgi:hypothetical protein
MSVAALDTHTRSFDDTDAFTRSFDDTDAFTWSLQCVSRCGVPTGADPGFEHTGGEEDITTQKIDNEPQKI